MHPKVSVCIPAYKSPELLIRALRSISIQAYTDYEVIITDDTVDASVEHEVKKLDDGRVHYFRNSNPLGSPENWNEGIRKASGELIKPMHHDDQFSDELSLGEYVRLLEEHPECDFAFSACINVNYITGSETLHQPSEKQLGSLSTNPYLLFPDNMIGAPSATLYRNRKDFFYDPKIMYVVDIEFYIRYLAKNPHFAYTERPLVRINTGSTSQASAACINDRRNELFEWFYLYDLLRRKGKLSPGQLRFLISLLRKYNITSRKGLLDETGLDILLSPQILLDFLRRKVRGWTRSGLGR